MFFAALTMKLQFISSYSVLAIAALELLILAIRYVLPNDHLTHILMYGSNVYNDITNESILRETIHFIKKSGRFEKLEAFP